MSVFVGNFILGYVCGLLARIFIRIALFVFFIFLLILLYLQHLKVLSLNLPKFFGLFLGAFGFLSVLFSLLFSSFGIGFLLGFITPSFFQK